MNQIQIDRERQAWEAAEKHEHGEYKIHAHWVNKKSYVAGWLAADTHPADLWIDCKVELPPAQSEHGESATWYFCFNENGYEMARYIHNEGDVPYWMVAWASDYRDFKPTHWMIPAPPSTK